MQKQSDTAFEGNMEIYKTSDNTIELKVAFKDETLWLTQNQMAELFGVNKSGISRHIKNIFETQELEEAATVAIFATVQTEGDRSINRKLVYYNLDMIISVGYRVNSKRGTQFRQWATQRLKDYLVKGYAINEKRLEQKNQEIEYLKTGIRIISRAMESMEQNKADEVFKTFAKGLLLLDDYDHKSLDSLGKNTKKVVYPAYSEYMELIQRMYDKCKSDVFAQLKDDGFQSSIAQISQSFDGKELYPTIEEKAANLLYFITKNHSFVDGNKRIAATCFLYFLQRNNCLLKQNGRPVIDNNTLASLTLFIASSKTDEADIVKHLTISILNRSQENNEEEKND